MTFSRFVTIHALIALFFGILCLLVPETLVSTYGMTLDGPGIIMTRFFGTALVNFALVLWLARNAGDSEARRAITLGFFIALVLGTLVAIQAQLTGLMNALGWTTVLLYGALACGHGYLHFKGEQPA